MVSADQDLNDVVDVDVLRELYDCFVFKLRHGSVVRQPHYVEPIPRGWYPISLLVRLS